MKLCLLGSTGLLGSSLYTEAKKRGYNTVGCARKGADVELDVTDDYALCTFICSGSFDIVINTVAIVNHLLCDENPGFAYTVNARPSAILTELSREKSFKYVYISTDGYYSNDKTKQHSEESPILLLNEYARTKFSGENFALSNHDNLVVRTNIVGFSLIKKQCTFLEWIVSSLQKNAQLTLFTDYFTSSISTTLFSKIFFDALPLNPHGVYNIACSEVFSKATFITEVAKSFNLHLKNTNLGSVHSLNSRRAESIGLSVNKIEALVGYSLPKLSEVIEQLRTEYHELCKRNIY